MSSVLNDKLVNMDFIVSYTGFTNYYFHRVIKIGRFPNAIKLGGSSRWLKSEVEQWSKDHIRNYSLD